MIPTERILSVTRLLLADGHLTPAGARILTQICGDQPHADWCHWGDGCCGCKCGAVPFGADDPSMEKA